MRIRNKKYTFTAFALIIYLIIINRASYLSVYVYMLLLAFFFFNYHKKVAFPARAGIWVVLTFFYLILGVIHGNDSNDILIDMMGLVPFPFLLAGSKSFYSDYMENQMEGIKKLLPFMVPAFFLIFIYMGYNWLGSAAARFDYNLDSKLSLFAPITPLVFVPWMLCFNEIKGTKLQKILLYIGALLFMYMGFITFTKSVFLSIVLIFVLKVLFQRSGVKRVKYLIGIALLIFLFFYFVELYLPEIYVAFSGKFDIDSGSNQDRWEESMTYLSKCDFFDILFGKGFGGIKTFYGEDYIGGISMIHMGWCHLIMKGGIILLITIYFPLIYIILNDLKKKHYVFVIMAIMFFFRELSHTQFQGGLESAVYWFLVYYRYYNPKALVYKDKRDIT